MMQTRQDEQARRRALVVEPHEDVRRLIVTMVKHFGYDASGVASIEDAVEALADSDVVLVDVGTDPRPVRRWLEDHVASADAPRVVLLSADTRALSMAHELDLPLLPMPFALRDLAVGLEEARMPLHAV